MGLLGGKETVERDGREYVVLDEQPMTEDQLARFQFMQNQLKAQGFSVLIERDYERAKMQILKSVYPFLARTGSKPQARPEHTEE